MPGLLLHITPIFSFLFALLFFGLFPFSLLSLAPLVPLISLSLPYFSSLWYEIKKKKNNVSIWNFFRFYIRLFGFFPFFGSTDNRFLPADFLSRSFTQLGPLWGKNPGQKKSRTKKSDRAQTQWNRVFSFSFKQRVWDGEGEEEEEGKIEKGRKGKKKKHQGKEVWKIDRKKKVDRIAPVQLFRWKIKKPLLQYPTLTIIHRHNKQPAEQTRYLSIRTQQAGSWSCR